MRRYVEGSAARGQGLIEFALMFPLLLLLLMGTIDVGRLLFASVAVEEAAQEGALFAAYAPCSSTDIEARVTSSSNADEVSGATVQVLPNNPEAGLITVVAHYDYPLITPLIQNMFGGPVRLAASVTATNFQGTCP